MNERGWSIADGSKRTGPPAVDAGSGGLGTPRDDYVAALRRYEGPRLRAISGSLAPDEGEAPARLADAIAGRLERPGAVEDALAGLAPGARVALGLFVVTETTTWPVA